MACCNENHKTLKNGVGMCSVPMWSGGCPAGFCDREAYGERPAGKTIRRWDGFEYRDDGLYAGYVPYLACPNHGGPAEVEIVYEQDGDMICAHFKDFANLQESPVGFGKTNEEALADLKKQVNSSK